MRLDHFLSGVSDSTLLELSIECSLAAKETADELEAVHISAVPTVSTVSTVSIVSVILTASATCSQ